MTTITVYVATIDDTQGTRILGVFDAWHKADAAIEAYPDHYNDHDILAFDVEVAL